jgi:cell division protein FtsX
MPFICEGFIAGVLGAALALGLLVTARFQLLPKLIAALPFLPMHAVTIDGLTFALELLGTGAAVGVVASWFSVGRYLRA